MSSADIFFQACSALKMEFYEGKKQTEEETLFKKKKKKKKKIRSIFYSFPNVTKIYLLFLRNAGIMLQVTPPPPPPPLL